MGKLHEVLAVERDLEAAAEKALNKVLAGLSRGKYVGRIRTYMPLEEGGDDFADEVELLPGKVLEDLGALQDAYGRWMDAALQKEVTNQKTSAELAVGDKLMNLPATALLNLENKLGQLRKVYNSIPTNDPAEVWEWDKQNEYWEANPRTTYKEVKVPKAFVAHEATKEHPAQVQVFNEAKRVGTWTTTIQSGMLTPAAKRAMVARLDGLLRNVKKARQRANDIEAWDGKLADAIFEYIHHGE